MRNLLVGGLIGAVAGGLVAYFLLWRPELERPIYRRSPAASPVLPSRPATAPDRDRALAPARATPPARTEATPPRPPAPASPTPPSPTPPSPTPPSPTSPSPTPPSPTPPDRARYHFDAIARTAPVNLEPTARPTARLRREDVQDAIRGATPVVKRCYEQALRSNPKLAGTLKVRFTVAHSGGAGRLKDAEILAGDDDDGLGNPFLGMCVLKALAEVEYPAPEGNGQVVVTYPFRMEPAAEEDE